MPRMFTDDGTIIDREVTETFNHILIRTQVLNDDGKIEHLYAGEEDYNNYPCWSRHNRKFFDTENDAVHFSKHLTGYGYRWKIIPNTVELINYSIEVHSVITEYDRVIKKVLGDEDSPNR